eukprot:5551666-Pyramimonas_sp.AAC.1
MAHMHSLCAVRVRADSTIKPRIALVTGANKGIGKEVARKLSSAGVKTVLGCRDKELGAATAAELQADGCDALSFQLDITSPDSVLRCTEFVHELGGLDILVNNAAICFNDPTLYGKCPPTPFAQQAAPSISTNFFGTLD